MADKTDVVSMDKPAAKIKYAGQWSRTNFRAKECER